jgi:hypothetical protein
MRRRIHVSYEEEDTCVISFVHCFRPMVLDLGFRG